MCLSALLLFKTIMFIVTLKYSVSVACLCDKCLITSCEKLLQKSSLHQLIYLYQKFSFTPYYWCWPQSYSLSLDYYLLEVFADNLNTSAHSQFCVNCLEKLEFTFQVHPWVLQLLFKQTVHHFPQVFEYHADPNRSL